MQKTIETGSRVGTVVRVVQGCVIYGISAGDLGVVVSYDAGDRTSLKHRVHFAHPRDNYLWMTDGGHFIGTDVVAEAVHPAPETEAPQPPKTLLEHQRARDNVQVGDVFKHKHRAGYFQVFTRTHTDRMFFLGIQEGAMTIPAQNEHYLNSAPYRDDIERTGWEYLPNARLGVLGEVAEE